MNIGDKFIRTFRVPVPLVDRILEIVGLCLLVGMLAFTAFLYQRAPEQIAMRFNGAGEPISWDNKVMYWYIAMLFVAMMLLSAASAYNFKLINLPFRLKEPVIGIQKMLIARMSRCLTLCMGLLWLAYLINTSVSFWNISLFAAIFSKVSLLCLFVVVFYYSVKAWWIGRKY